jgi:hypothetical protein
VVSRVQLTLQILESGGVSVEQAGHRTICGA